ncbi:MAG: hypothetical protein CYPHOPRED_004760 [Cyphobasidiales sp. Tagirdzhanova-0007]|nr:MAG: hypothetical protein CYPHOPRED_004760 [Cyphobasidiales sp. Tagirdzhanova-0007]
MDFGDFTPLTLLQYTFDTVSPYLPSPVRILLSLGLKSISSLPPSVANVLPLLLAAFAIYTSFLSFWSTARFALRKTWWMLKWGTVAAGIAWAFGATPNLQAQTQGARGLFNRMQNNYYTENSGLGGLAGYAQQAAAAAGVPGMGGRQGDIPAGAEGGGLLGDLMKDPLRTVLGEAINFISPSDKDTSSKTRRSRKGQEEQKAEQAEKFKEGVKDVAGSWVADLAGKAWEAFNTGQARR